MFNLQPTNPADLPTDVLPAICLYITAGLAVVAGVLLVLWGHRAWAYRGFIVLVGAGIAWLLAPVLQAQLGERVDENITRGVLVFALAVIGLVTARGTWALISMGTASLLVALGMLAWLVGDAVTLPEALAKPTVDAATWFSQFWDHASTKLQTSLGYEAAAVYGAAGLIGGIVLVMAMTWPKGTGVFITPLIGSILLVVGALALAGTFKPDWWTGAFANKLWPGIALGVLFLLGLILQTRGVKAMKRKEAEELEAEY